eukprot:scaffold29925_cov45-Attheya_sp.AAC.2
MPLPEARAAVRAHFERNAAIKDDRVLEMLVERGYMELEAQATASLASNIGGILETRGSYSEKVACKFHTGRAI